MDSLIQEFQRNLRGLDSWIQEAEELLESHEDADDHDDVALVRLDFHQHEEFMAELAQNQRKIEDIIAESQALISSPETRPTQRAEIRKQRDLLNIRWNKLKNRAVERQSHLQDSLMLLQQKQLDNMKAWLIFAEDKIAAFTDPGPDLDAIITQVEDHKRFQDEVAGQQEVVNSLANFVLVEDEAGNDELEDQLTALGEKWAHVCRFVEERGSMLEMISRGWQLLVDEENNFNLWISKLDKRLSEMEEAAAETDTESDFVPELIKRLQKLEEEMEKQHVHYSEIADEGQKLLERLGKKSLAAVEVGRILERLTEVWDSTVQRMENLGQALTTASSLRRSQRKTNGDSRNPGASKKRRIDSKGVREWQRALENASTWMGRIEGDLGLDEPEQGSVVWEELAIEEQQILLEDTEAAVDAKRSEIEQLIVEGRQLLQELDMSKFHIPILCLFFLHLFVIQLVKMFQLFKIFSKVSRNVGL